MKTQKVPLEGLVAVNKFPLLFSMVAIYATDLQKSPKSPERKPEQEICCLLPSFTSRTFFVAGPPQFGQFWNKEYWEMFTHSHPWLLSTTVCPKSPPKYSSFSTVWGGINRRKAERSVLPYAAQQHKPLLWRKPSSAWVDDYNAF